MDRTLILIPVFNEEATLAGVLLQVRKAAPDADVLVVDDGSTDRSPEILAARPDIRVIRHEDNRGYGQSLITGFTDGTTRGYEIILTIDCDEQHEPRRIQAFRDRVGQSDIVSGSRYLDPSVPGDPPPHDRMQLNREFTALIRAVTGYEITDAW
ncbi:MAG TPA: glycosyltransferase family 2 protein, partial [bacterium]|nr:glycosyltransferase family 2 protein [bacterium]